jgi:hypothetical protein
MSIAEAVILGLSVLLLVWIGVALIFLRNRLGRPRPYSPPTLAVGPILYALAMIAVLRGGLAVDLPWAAVAVFLGGLLAVLRSRGTRVWRDDLSGKRLIATSPIGLVSIATIALVQPLVLATRFVLGRNLNEAALHQTTVLFLLALSVIYVLLVAVRMRKPASGLGQAGPEGRAGG